MDNAHWAVFDLGSDAIEWGARPRSSDRRAALEAINYLVMGSLLVAVEWLYEARILQMGSIASRDSRIQRAAGWFYISSNTNADVAALMRPQ